MAAVSTFATPEVCAIAIDIAREAGALIRSAFGFAGRVDFKGAVNPVTETDVAAERIIHTRLRSAFPSHRIYGEELGEDQGAARLDSKLSGESEPDADSPLWLVDPLDGTNNFAHGFPHFAVSLGLVADGEIQVGVVHDPLRDATFAAYRGGGATLNGDSIHVSRVAALSEAFLATGFPYNRRIAATNNTRMLDHFLRRSQGVRRAGSAALDMAYVAWGRFDGYWEPSLSPWDVAGGLLLVQEAGGHISDFSGARERLFSGAEVVASNGAIHGEMLAVLRHGAAAPHPDFPDL
ncbi:MAG: inositol monophosphatase [Anaerolineae bacterium]|nr:inositol monophosphatase [Anaerolineae bacterium]